MSALRAKDSFKYLKIIYTILELRSGASWIASAAPHVQGEFLNSLTEGELLALLEGVYKSLLLLSYFDKELGWNIDLNR